MTQVLVAFSDTGGGHRAAARAVQEALLREADHVAIRLVDPYALSGRWPFDRLASAYPRVVDEASWLWRAGFHATNHRALTAAAQALAWPALRGAFEAIRTDGVPDVIVSTHPLLSAPLRRVFPDVPMVVVVTDLVSGHVSWYERSADLVVVATDAARRQAIVHGVAPERTAVLGLPIAPAFERISMEGSPAPSLGWSSKRPTVLLMGGGDGVGPLEALAVAIDEAQLPCDLAIVAGRNSALRERLLTRPWRGRTHVYGFVSNLPDLLRAASVLITKAGPGTICEAFAAGCPLVLFGAIPGQETGNLRLVAESGAGQWAPSPRQVVEAVRNWTSGPAAEVARLSASRAALAAATPGAARAIAREVLALGRMKAVRHCTARRQPDADVSPIATHTAKR